MTQTDLSEDQVIVRLTIFTLVVLGIFWAIGQSNHDKSAPASAGSIQTSSQELKVQPSASNSSAPQQTANPGQNSNDQIQAGPSNLQSAQTSDQLSPQLKQELGL